nr:leukocidin family pore-forming toxin [Staphylococcus aureus]
MLKNKILATTLSVSLLAPLANPIFENAKAANDTEDIGKGSDIEIIKRTEDKTSNKWGVTQNIQFDFVKDKKYNKDALIVKMQGLPLVHSGFNPSFIATVSHEKDSSDTSEFEITYGRNMDVTHAIKRSTHYGNSYLDGHRIHNAFKNRNYTVKYEVNWKTHEIKVKG